LEEVAVMSKPSPKANLLLYIAATDTAVSAVLVEERMEVDTLKQFSIYYASEALSGSKLFYSFRDGEDGIRSRNGLKEASALFSEPQHISTHRIPPSGHV
jgi:hypothetical protein